MPKLIYKAKCTNGKGANALFETDDFDEMKSLVKDFKYAYIKVYSGDKLIDYGQKNDIFNVEYTERLSNDNETAN